MADTDRLTLQARLKAGEQIVAPGVFDLISAKIADRMGFPALYMTGYGTVASHLGLPDAGLATYSDMVGRVERIAGAVSTPLIADADTGYGGLLNVRQTVRGYEAAGAAAIQLEDQEFPKKCGHTPNRRVVPMAAMVAKIEVAVEARRSDDFLIIARTDARTGHGLNEALRRAAAYREAGADILFVESPENEEELAEIGRRLDGPRLVNLVEGGRTPIVPHRRLAELGFQVVLHPATGFLAAAAALGNAYRSLGLGGDDASLLSFSEMNEIIGFPEIWELEREHAE